MTRISLSIIAALAISLAACQSQSSKAAKSSDSGFKPIFNGKDFTGWKIVSGRAPKDAVIETNKLFCVHDGMVHMYRDVEHGTRQPFGYIVTEKEYSHYHLRFQYKWGEKKFIPKFDAKKDAGLLYHVYGNDGVWPKSVECQVQETDTGDIFTVSTRVQTTIDPDSKSPTYLPASKGGVEFVQGVSQGVKRVMKSPMAEVDGWNTVEVIVRGDTSVHIINGVTNNATLKMEKFEDGKWVPLTKGKILLQQEGAEIFYRNIEVKELQ